MYVRFKNSQQHWKIDLDWIYHDCTHKLGIRFIEQLHRICSKTSSATLHWQPSTIGLCLEWMYWWCCALHQFACFQKNSNSTFEHKNNWTNSDNSPILWYFMTRSITTHYFTRRRYYRPWCVRSNNPLAMGRQSISCRNSFGCLLFITDSRPFIRQQQPR